MSDIELKESIQQAIQRLTHEQQLKLLEFINVMVKKSEPKNDTWEPLSLEIPKRPEDLNALAVREADLKPLIDLFSDELSAEELCKLL